MNKNLFKILIISNLIVLLNACTSYKKNLKWSKIDNKTNILFNVEAGDIILKEKTLSILGIFGHCAIMKDRYNLIDYPKIGKISYKISLSNWVEKNRDILILRYKNITEVFKENLIKNLEKYSGRKYKIIFDKKKSDSFYCSQFIWFIYYITAEEMGFKLDIDSNGGFFVFPYDFIDSKELTPIK